MRSRQAAVAAASLFLAAAILTLAPPAAAASADRSCSSVSTGSSSVAIEQCQLLLSSGLISPGHALGVSGAGIRPDARVTLAVEPRVLRSDAKCGRSGAFHVRVAIPKSAHPGSYLVVARGPDAVGHTIYLTAQLVIARHGAAAAHAPKAGRAAARATNAVIAVANITLIERRGVLLGALAFILGSCAVVIRSRKHRGLGGRSTRSAA